VRRGLCTGGGRVFTFVVLAATALANTARQLPHLVLTGLVLTGNRSLICTGKLM
jgi:hypothetical protein